MRFDTPIFFVTKGEATLDPKTGDYMRRPDVEKKAWACITDAGEELLQLVYTGIRQGSKVIRTRASLPDHFDYIRVGETHYQVDYTVMPRNIRALVVSEVKN